MIIWYFEARLKTKVLIVWVSTVLLLYSIKCNCSTHINEKYRGYRHNVTFGPVGVVGILCLLGNTDATLPTAVHMCGGWRNNLFAVILHTPFWCPADLQCSWVTGWLLPAKSSTWSIGIHTRFILIRLYWVYLSTSSLITAVFSQL